MMEKITYLVIRRGDTLESLEAVESSSTVRSLVGEHTTNSAPEHAGRSLVVEGALTGVGVHALTEEVSPEHLVAEEGTRDVKLFGADANNALTVEELLCDESSEATDEVTLAVNNNNLYMGETNIMGQRNQMNASGRNNRVTKWNQKDVIKSNLN